MFASAAHRHAWHAQLWEQRAPTIPVEPDTEPSVGALDREVDPSERRDVYRAALESEITRVATVAAGVDRELDPSTARVIDLVSADLSDLLALGLVT
jgi:hypothetical protein